MKIYKSNFRDHWLSPYTILERVCFWEKDRDRFYNIDDDHKNPYDRWVNFLEPICQALNWFLDRVHPRINYVKIDRWDTWSMDSTLADIILPMLRQLKEKKHGSPFVDDEDVPEHLRSGAAPPKENDWDTDDNHHARWDWVMSEMIFAFEHLVDDSWENDFCSGVIDHVFVPCEDNPKFSTMEDGPNHTWKCDYDGMNKVNERINNGLRLFGKYYRGLWD